MNFTRREFLKISALSASTIFISTALNSCEESINDNFISVTFEHGVASGDPLSNKVILWTRATPKERLKDNEKFTINYEIAIDKNFKDIVRKGSVTTSKNRDYTIKIDVQNLQPATTYFYRFNSKEIYSPIGRTKTTPVGNVEKVKMAVFSCANFTNGYFNAYMEASKIEDLDVSLHLGDYIYEYGMYAEDDGKTPAYATKNAKNIGRVLPDNNNKECIALEDYRRRYALYHTDLGTQAIHAACPMIVVWDDHEIANDAYKNGAQNHQDDEGSWEKRVSAALQAYFEWLPIRSVKNRKEIYRSFNFGNLVSLHMLETRLNARSKQLSYLNYSFKDGSFDTQKFIDDILSPNQVLLGAKQLQWLQEKLQNSTATWQVLGQQILMAKMMLPAELLNPIGKLDYVQTKEEYNALIKQINTLLKELSSLKIKKHKGAILTQEEEQRLSTVLPYNLDAWDGYGYEREVIFNTVKTLGKNLVVLSGDTHNGWKNNLVDKNGDSIGVEFATASISSPGFEDYVNLDTVEKAINFEGALELLIDDLEYLNAMDRGFMVVTFTPTNTTSTWIYIANTDKTIYAVNQKRSKHISVNL